MLLLAIAPMLASGNSAPLRSIIFKPDVCAATYAYLPETLIPQGVPPVEYEPTNVGVVEACMLSTVTEPEWSVM
jgi:hypothetical protein